MGASSCWRLTVLTSGTLAFSEARVVTWPVCSLLALLSIPRLCARSDPRKSQRYTTKIESLGRYHDVRAY